jgi:hypothetical protein
MEQNKLALDLLIEWLNKNKRSIEHNFTDGFSQLTNVIDTLKQLEKQNIIDAYWGGLNGSINDYSECKSIGNGNVIGIKAGGGAEKYYNETFNK